LKKIDLQILEYGENKTTKYKDSIRITKLGKSPSLSFNHAKSSLCLSIPENENFRDYTISLKNDAHHLLSDLKQNQEGFYTISVQQYKPKPSSSQKRSIYLDCKMNDKIEVFYDGLPCEIITNNCIKIAGTRDKISVKLGDRELKFKKVGNDRIKIYPPLFGCLSGGKTRLMLIGIVAMLMLLVSVLLTLQFTNIIDIKKWFAQIEDKEEVKGIADECTPPPVLDTIPEDQRLREELDSILKVQRVQWNYNEIHEKVSHFDTILNLVQDSTHIGYQLYKELVWMQCRRRLDGYESKGDYKIWISLIKERGINTYNKEFATPDLYDFLNGIVQEKHEEKHKQFFEQYVKTK
jgi:hypothetical protein